MSKNIKLIPELRFPEFENDGEWEESEIGKLFKFKQGVQVSVENQYLSKKDGLVRFIRIIDITSNTEAPRYIENPGEDHLIKKDNLFMIRYGTPGLTSIGYEGVIANNLFRLIWKVDKQFDALFWFYSFQKVEKTIYNLSGSSSMPAISFSTLDNIKISYPKKNQEQQKIASCLSSLDEVIAAHSQKLELLKDHKKGLMQNLFPQSSLNHDSKGLNDSPDYSKVPKYRFPEFIKKSSNQENQTNQGSDNGEWVEKELKDVFSIFQGFAFSSDESVANGTRWLKIADVGIQQMKNDTPSYLPKSFQELFEKFLVKKGDYVLALTRPILNMQLKIAQVDNTFHNALLNQRVGKIVTKNNKSFVYYLIQTADLVSSINNNIAGNEPPNLSFQQIENILIFIPPSPNEQQKIAFCLSSLDALISAQAEKIEQLKLHKKGLMQGLFPKLSEL